MLIIMSRKSEERKLYGEGSLGDMTHPTSDHKVTHLGATTLFATSAIYHSSTSLAKTTFYYSFEV